MNQSFIKAGLLMFGLFVQSGAIFAQAPVPGPDTMPGALNANVVVNEIQEAAPGRPAHKFLNNHGMGCYADNNMVGCGNFWTEFRFIFGSCRSFFGQPCIPNPPHSGFGANAPQKCCGN